MMKKKYTYEELEKKIIELEQENSILRNDKTNIKKTSQNTLSYDFMALAESISDIILRIDKDLNVTYVNPAFRREFGVSLNEVVGKNLKELNITEKEFYKWKEAILEAFSTRKEQCIEISFKRKNRIKYYRNHIIPEFDFSGQVVTVLGITRNITDFRKTEEALRDSEEKFKLFVENFPGFVYVKDIKSGEILQSKRYEEFFEIQFERFLDENIDKNNDNSNWEKSDEEERILQLKQSEYLELEHQILHKDNVFHTYAIYKFPIIRNNGDKLIGVLAIEITDRKNAEEKLRDSESKYKLLAESTTDAIWTMDLNLVTTYISPSIKKQLGFSSEEYVKLSLEQRFPPHSALLVRKLFECELRKALKSNIFTKPHSFVYEIEHKHKDGYLVWGEVNVTFIRNKTGEIIGLHGVTRNIEDRKRAEKSLKESEERYRLLAENSIDIISRHSPDSTFLFVSPACKTVLGYEVEELLGKKAYDFIHPDDLNYLIKKTAKISIEKDSITVKNRFRKKDGNYIWQETNTKGNFDIYNNLVDTVSVSRDITEKIKKEELVRQKRAAEAANKAKSLFLANISHEIRNPMNIIVGMTNLLQRTKLDKDQLMYADALVISSNNLLHILNDILDFSKIEANKIELNKQDFNLLKNVSEIVTLYKHQAKQKNVKLTEIYDNKIPNLLNGDIGKLRQILMNLLGNSVKFTEQGEINLTVEISKQNRNIIYLRFSITDTGIGIRKEDYAKLFKSFSQVDVSTTKQYSGTGLGLTIVKKYTELLGGKVLFTSEYEIGTTFTIDVPFDIVANNHIINNKINTTDKIQIHINNKNQILNGSLNILLVEDDSINQLYLKKFLQSKGWKVDSAFNGIEAVEKAKNKIYDLIFMDGQMPKMDGFEATSHIRKIEDYKNIPIIAITGYALKDDRQKFLNAGMDDYLTKPINESHLLEIINKYIAINTKK